MVKTKQGKKTGGRGSKSVRPASTTQAKTTATQAAALMIDLEGSEYWNRRTNNGGAVVLPPLSPAILPLDEKRASTTSHLVGGYTASTSHDQEPRRGQQWAKTSLVVFVVFAVIASLVRLARVAGSEGFGLFLASELYDSIEGLQKTPDVIRSESRDAVCHHEFAVFTQGLSGAAARITTLGTLISFKESRKVKLAVAHGEPRAILRHIGTLHVDSVHIHSDLNAILQMHDNLTACLNGQYITFEKQIRDAGKAAVESARSRVPEDHVKGKAKTKLYHKWKMQQTAIQEGLTMLRPTRRMLNLHTQRYKAAVGSLGDILQGELESGNADAAAAAHNCQLLEEAFLTAATQINPNATRAHEFQLHYHSL